MAETVRVPLQLFLWKIASRCNLNCSYCFVYNSQDVRWQLQPPFMSEDVARRAAVRIREHCISNNRAAASIVFHGGEPLLGGARHLDMLTRVIREELIDQHIQMTVGMQSNGLLFTPEIGDLMLGRSVTVGVSLDGPPKINDKFRVDHAGKPTSHVLQEKLSLLTSPKYRSLLKGFLCVIDVSADPIEVIRYLFNFCPQIDLLLPLNNHTYRPYGKEWNIDTTIYGDWLIKAFDYWFDEIRDGKIRIFSSIMDMLLGGHSEVESLGVGPVDLVVIETNGQIEAVDCLKSTFDGATVLGFNIFDHDFDTVARHHAIRSRQIGADALCSTCRECPHVKVCGGGYLPHRYSRERGFDNPSVYCSDLMKLINHIRDRMTHELYKEAPQMWQVNGTQFAPIPS